MSGASALVLAPGSTAATAVTGAVLAYVVIQRLVELAIARRNTAALLEDGAREASPGHYPVIVMMHAGWLAGLFVLVWDRPVNLVLLAVFAGVQGARIWTLHTLGARWTTRIIVPRDAALVTSGPYRFVNHPNYLVVIAEFALLPLVFDLPVYAGVFSALNAAMLTVRISAEERAIAAASAGMGRRRC